MTTWKEKMERDTAYASRFPQFIGNIADKAEAQKKPPPKKKAKKVKK